MFKGDRLHFKKSSLSPLFFTYLAITASLPFNSWPLRFVRAAAWAAMEFSIAEAKMYSAGVVQPGCLSIWMRCLKSSRYCPQIGLELSELEPWRKAGLLCFRRKNCVGLVDTFIPPCPSRLLSIPPGEDGHTGRIVCDGKYRTSCVSWPGVHGRRASNCSMQFSCT